MSVEPEARDTQHALSAAQIYLLAAPVCLIAPLVIPFGTAFMVLGNVVLLGLPMTIMALLLANIHARHGLTAIDYKVAALVWVVCTLFLLAPLPAWAPSSQISNAIMWARIAFCGATFIVFARLAWKTRRLLGRSRWLISLGFAAVALFFGTWSYGIVHSLVVEPLNPLEASVEEIAAFFMSGLITNGLLLPAAATGWFWRREA